MKKKTRIIVFGVATPLPGVIMGAMTVGNEQGAALLLPAVALCSGTQGPILTNLS
jgi:hypothetical protein